MSSEGDRAKRREWNRRYQQNLRAELVRLRAERGPYWRPRAAPRHPEQAPGEQGRAAAEAEIEAAYFRNREARKRTA